MTPPKAHSLDFKVEHSEVAHFYDNPYNLGKICKNCHDFMTT